jgi:peptidoglycan/LPS O-acetylase OafA/YrhL
MQKKALAPLTSLRFFAAILVIFFHNPGVFYNLFVEKLGFYSGFLVVHHGYAMVAFFFVLSGFILAYNYHGHQFTHKHEVFRFYAARIARIYPAYILSIIIGLPFLISYVFHNAYTQFEWIKAVTVFPLSLVMLQSWAPFWLDSFANINPPGWSLSVELFLYLLFPGLLFLVRNLKTGHLLLLLPMLALIGMGSALFFEWKYFDKVIFMSSLQTLEIPAGGISWMSLTNTLPIIHVPQFLIGVVGGIYFVRYNALLTLAAKWLIWPVVLFILWVYASDHFSSRSMQTGLMAIPYLLLIILSVTNTGVFSKILSLPLFVRLGEISYCVYIFAFPVEYYFTAFFEQVLHMKMSLVLFSIYFASLLVFCNWFYSYEEKWREIIKKKINNLLLVSNRS